MEHLKYKGPITRSKIKNSCGIYRSPTEHSLLYKKKGPLSDRLDKQLSDKQLRKSRNQKCKNEKSKNFNQRRESCTNGKAANIQKPGKTKKKSVRRVKEKQTVTVKHARSREKDGYMKQTVTPSSAVTNVNKNVSSLKNVFEVNEISSIRCIQHNPHAICPVSDDKAWVALNFQENIYLYNKRGELEKTLAMPGSVDDITVRPDGSLLVTNYGGSKVWSVNKTYDNIKEEKIFSKEPFLCRGIHWTESGILICYVDYLSSSDGPDSERFILKIADNGKTLERYEKKGKNKLFNSLYRINSNANGEILVVDNGRYQLIILDTIGREKSRYSGQLQQSNIYGACCNREGFIFVSDYDGRCIDALYPDGSFCQTIVKFERCHPNGIALDDSGHLWVGCVETSELRIYSLSRQ